MTSEKKASSPIQKRVVSQAFLLCTREARNFAGLVLFGATYGAALDYAHTHGGCIEYPAGTRHERGILTFATVYSVVPLMVSLYRMKTEHSIEMDPISGETLEENVKEEEEATELGRSKKSPTLSNNAPPYSSCRLSDSKDLLPSLTEAAAAAIEVSSKGSPAVKSDQTHNDASSSSSRRRANMYSLAIKSLPRNARVNFTPEENNRRRFARKQEIAPWRHAFTAMSVLFTSGYLLTAYAWKKVPSVAIAAALACPTLYFFKRWDWSFNSFLVMIAVGVSGAGTEAFLNSYVKSMTYQTDDILGIPCWLFWVYTLNFATYGQLTRFLLEPKHTKKVFVGVEDLPHRWARKFYANHVGLPPTIIG